MTYQRCRYNSKVEKIPIQEISGQLYTLLNDVRDRFPDVTYFEYKNVPIPFEYDSNNQRLKPTRIKANVEIIIDCCKPRYDAKLTLQIGDDVREELSEIRQDLAIIKANTASISRKIFELAEFTTPRLFIVLPDYTPHYKLNQWLQLHYRLYFLCECENDNERHFAFHDGYELKKPREFFCKYGSYLTKMLTIVKYASRASLFIVPNLSHAVSGISALTTFSNQFHLNQLPIRIEWIEDILKEAAKSFKISVDRDVQYLEGVQLREIEFFLKKTDEHCKFGNLSCSVTNDGHVRWVCFQHRDEHYSTKAIKSLREEFQTLGGEIKNDAAFVEGNASEKFPEMLTVLTNGLPLFSIVLKDSQIKEKHFNDLLDFVSR